VKRERGTTRCTQVDGRFERKRVLIIRKFGGTSWRLANKKEKKRYTGFDLSENKRGGSEDNAAESGGSNLRCKPPVWLCLIRTLRTANEQKLLSIKVLAKGGKRQTFAENTTTHNPAQ